METGFLTAGGFAALPFPKRLRSRGGRLAFLCARPSLEANRTRCDLWWRPPGGPPAPLTHSGDVQRFWWRSDDTLVFTRRPAEGQEDAPTPLYALRLSAPGEAALWRSLPGEVEDIAFLPDGRMLTLGCSDKPPLPEGAREEDAGRYELLTELPVWANGGGFTSGRRTALWLWQGDTPQRLTGPTEEAEQLCLSPCGQAAWYLAANINPVAPVSGGLFRLPLATLRPEALPPPAEGFRYDRIVPLADGGLVAMGSDMRRYGINQNGGFWRLTPGGGWQPLYDGGEYGDWCSVGSDVGATEGAQWQQGPDGAVYWSTTLGHNGHLMRLDPASGAITALTRAEGAVAEFAPLEEGWVISALRGEAGWELYHLPPQGGERQLSRFSHEALAGVPLAKAEPLHFTGEDGTALSGWVMQPPGLAEGEAAPAVLLVHGGPKTVYGPVLFHEMQYLAAQGFGVLFCNIRGSDGRGDDFADIRGRYGTVDFDDLMRFCDAVLAANRWIDAKRLGIAGGSYGGFMVNWAIGSTRRFAAAVSQRGIANWGSMAMMSDIGWYFEPDQAGATLWDDAAAVWRASPLRLADRAETPTLFIHSEADYRCPMAEGLQMYTALRARGVPARLCLFKGENHELSRSGAPRARVVRLEEMAAWFHKYL